MYLKSSDLDVHWQEKKAAHILTAQLRCGPRLTAILVWCESTQLATSAKNIDLAPVFGRCYSSSHLDQKSDKVESIDGACGLFAFS